MTRLARLRLVEATLIYIQVQCAYLTTNQSPNWAVKQWLYFRDERRE